MTIRYGLLYRCTALMLLATLLGGGTVVAQDAAHAVRFEENRGQVVDAVRYVRPDVLFTASASGVRVFLRTTGISYVFTRVDRDTTRPTRHIGSDSPMGAAMPDTSLRLTTLRMDMELVGANPHATVTAEGCAADSTNYYLGHCPQGITGVRNWERVTYHDIYPHIDLVYYSAAAGMKYDFIVHPGGRASDIAMRYIGSSAVSGESSGRVSITNALGRLEEGRPVAYQRLGAGRARVRSGYLLSDSTLRFELGVHDAARDVVIDPTLNWSTLFGGVSYEQGTYHLLGAWTYASTGMHFAVDGDTSVTMSGSTISIDLPITPGVEQTALANSASGYADAFIACFSQRGARRWATYFGGNSVEYVFAATGDRSGNSYLVTESLSLDFVTTPGTYMPVRPSPSPATMCWALVKFNNTGRLTWSTWITGILPTAITVDRWSNPIVAGSTEPGFTTTPGAFQTTFPGGQPTGSITRFNANGSARLWATLFGGTPQIVQLPTQPGGTIIVDHANGIATDTSGNIYLCGATAAADFPTSPGANQSAVTGKIDVFIAKFDSGGHRNWCTCQGGAENEVGLAIAVDVQGNATIVGSTGSTNFPVNGRTFQSSLHGNVDGFVAHYDSSGRILWSTYLGGADSEKCMAVTLDAHGRALVAGYTTSADWPLLADPYQPNLAGRSDVSIAKIDTDGRYLWGTYLGGIERDIVGGIMATRFGFIVGGETFSQDFPTTAGVFQRTLAGQSDVFLTAFCDIDTVLLTAGGPTRFCLGDSVVLSASAGFDNYSWSTGATTRSITVRQAGTYNVAADIAGCGTTSAPIQVVVHAIPQRTLIPHTIQFCQGDSIVITAAGGSITSYRWSTGDTTRTITVKASGRFSLFFADSNGCVNRTDTATVLVLPVPAAPVLPNGPFAFCDGGSVVLDAGAGLAQYQWNTGDTTRLVTVTRSGSFSVRVRNAVGCWSPGSNAVTVTVHANPKVEIRNVLPKVFCEGDSTILVASPATFASYAWSNGATTPTITVRKTGTYTLTATDTNGCTATANVAISVTPRPHPQLTVNGPTRFCEGGSVILSVNGFAGTQWSTGSTSQSIVVKIGGKYFATVTNENGCVGASDTVTVEVLPLPSLAITGPIRVCRDAAATYTVAAGSRLKYDWTVGGDGAIVAGAGTNAIGVQWGSSGGGVSVRVTNDSTGCSADTTIAVTVGSSLVPVIATDRPPRLCAGDAVVLDAGTYASYRWSTGATTRTITVSTAGAYAVTVGDARGCNGTSDTMRVTVSDPPVPVIAVPNGGVFCAGDSIVLDAGPGYVRYRWSNGFTSQQIAVRSSGEYTVTVTDTNGCEGTSAAPVQIRQAPSPSPVIAGPRQVCRNSAVNYSTPPTAGSTYQWTVAGGVVQSGQGTSAIRVAWGAAAAGHVDVTERTTLGCEGASPGLAVTIGDHLVPEITPSGVVVLCAGGSVRLDAGAGYASYRWSTGSTAQSIDATTAGAYTVAVTDSSGCGGTSDTVTVVVKALPSPAITALGPLEFCEGDSVALVADAGYAAYAWTTGSTARRITVTTSGAYGVTVTDVDGCTGSSAATTVTVHPLPPKPVIAQAGDVLTAPSSSSYQWQVDGSAIAGATSQIYRATISGAYTVTVGNAWGCRSTSDPVTWRALASSRNGWIDTASSRVGDRVRLRLHLSPALTVSEGVHGYHAEVTYDPRALFVHDVISPDRGVTGDAASYRVGPSGVLTIDRPMTAAPLTGDVAAQIEVEGLVTGVPLNVVTLRALVLPETAGPGGVAAGLLILSGCELGTSFGKRVHVEAIVPNPAHEEMVVRYRLPAGRTGLLSLTDASGGRVLVTTMPAGTGDYQEVRLSVSVVASGAYMLELHDEGERSAVPVVIVK